MSDANHVTVRPSTYSMWYRSLQNRDIVPQAARETYIWWGRTTPPGHDYPAAIAHDAVTLVAKILFNPLPLIPEWPPSSLSLFRYHQPHFSASRVQSQCVHPLCLQKKMASDTTRAEALQSTAEILTSLVQKPEAALAESARVAALQAARQLVTTLKKPEDELLKFAYSVQTDYQPLKSNPLPLGVLGHAVHTC